jgi:signal peptidase I
VRPESRSPGARPGEQLEDQAEPASYPEQIAKVPSQTISQEMLPDEDQPALTPETPVGPPERGVVPGVEAVPVLAGTFSAKKKRSALWEWIETIVIALILALVLRTFIVQPFEVHLSSMVPTLVEGDFILVSKLAYKLGTPQRGDVVVFPPPNGATNDYVKRVIGLPGETIDIQDGIVKINGTPLAEPWAHGQTSGGRYNHIEIPQGTVFCMGDNRMNSSDSRNWGSVSISVLEGKVILLFWPFTHFKWTF